MPAFIATLGIQNIARGFSKVITNAAPIANLPEEISVFGRQSIGFVPVSVILMVAVFAIFIFVTTKTKYGRYVYSVGGNKEAAYFAGINVKLIKMSVYVVSGLLAAFGGIVLMSRLDSASITNANLYEFDSIIASVIGGLSHDRRKGKDSGRGARFYFPDNVFQRNDTAKCRPVLSGCAEGSGADSGYRH
jgi:ribose transport system permease protein